MTWGSRFGWRNTPGMSTNALRSIIAFRSDPPEDRRVREESDESGLVGGKPSFEAVLQSYHGKVYNLAYRLIGDRDEAADLTQETFVRAFKAYPRFEGTAEAAYAWLCRIAVNGCKNRLRQLSRQNRYEAQSLDEPFGRDDPLSGLEIRHADSGPAGALERKDLEARVQAAIQALPPEFRVVVVLRDVQGLSYKDIAEVTGATLEVVKVRLFRGRTILRSRLGPFMEPGTR
jgi:RNA polymerase sigma-70 factor, ECF subfamily